MAEIPTINKEYVVANCGFTANKYTKMGTVSIEPPLSIKPNENANTYC